MWCAVRVVRAHAHRTPAPEPHMARPLEEFLARLPRDTVSLALRIGERVNPRDAGYVDLDDFGGLAGLDVAGLAAELRERAEGAGWGIDWPTFRLEAKPEAKGAGKMSASWQETAGAGRAKDAGPAGPGDAYMAATDLAKSVVATLAKSNADLTAALGQARAEADGARAQAVDAILDAKDAETAAVIEGLKADLAGGQDPAAERGASALERLGEALLGRMGGATGTQFTPEELLGAMEGNPAFVEALLDDERAQKLVAEAMARKAAKDAGQAPPA